LWEGLNIHRPNDAGDTPLDRARSASSWRYRNGANIHVQNNEEETHVHHTAYMGRTGVVHLLMDRGANIDLRNNEGETPLYRAVSASATLSRFPFSSGFSSASSSLELVQTLLERGADTNLQNSEEATPLHCAASYHETSELVQMLLDQGADVNRQNSQGETPSYRATSRS
jgi:ankyrin repeat protein